MSRQKVDMPPTKQRRASFKLKERNRTPITVRLSPSALAVLEQLIAIEGAKSYQAERAIERALFVLDSLVQKFYDQMKEAAATGRDLDKLMNRMRADFAYREEQ